MPATNASSRPQLAAENRECGREEKVHAQPLAVGQAQNLIDISTTLSKCKLHGRSLATENTPDLGERITDHPAAAIIAANRKAAHPVTRVRLLYGFIFYFAHDILHMQK